MIIKNITSGKILTLNAKFLTSPFEKSLGLLSPKNPRSIIFKTRFGIHTFFLKEPIDVLILSNDNKVVSLKQNLKPNRLYFWNPKYSKVVELKANSIKKTQTKKSHLITLIPSL